MIARMGFLLFNNSIQAARVNDIEAVEMWFECNSPLECDFTNKYGYTPLHYAAKFNRFEIFEWLLNKGEAGMYIVIINSGA